MNDFVKIELDDAEVHAAFQRLIDTTSDLEPVFRDIGELITKSTKDRFVDGKSPDGEKWQDNASSTLARKSGNKPLVGETKRLSHDIAYALLNDGVEIGSSREYAAMQQFGGTKAEFPNLWGDIPARPFLGISSDDEQDILATIIEAIAP